MRDDGHPSAEPFDDIRLGRASGVINPPATERQSHYLHVRPAEQFDAMIHVDTTRALKPPELPFLPKCRRPGQSSVAVAITHLNQIAAATPARTAAQ
jgi:hypothetical protein